MPTAYLTDPSGFAVKVSGFEADVDAAVESFAQVQRATSHPTHLRRALDGNDVEVTVIHEP